MKFIHHRPSIFDIRRLDRISRFSLSLSLDFATEVTAKAGTKNDCIGARAGGGGGSKLDSGSALLAHPFLHFHRGLTLAGYIY